jgi:16S rRNA (uracil1498-N3)-methyltransferase
MAHRALCEHLAPGIVTITDSEAHHLLHVLRAKPGHRLQLFDGRGAFAAAEVVAVSRRELQCSVEAVQSDPSSDRPHLTILVAPPKGERLKWLVEKLTELGVDCLTLLQTTRTVVVPGETRLDRLRAAVVAACKQCGRNRLMEIRPVTELPVAIQPAADNPLRLIADPGAGSRPLSAVLATTERTRRIEVLVGPEGGFTDDEMAGSVRAGGIPVRWPGGVLRIETAALAFACVLMHDRA